MSEKIWPEDRLASRSSSTFLVLRGRPAPAILGYAKSRSYVEQPSLIVAGSRGLGGVLGMVFGSTSHTLMTHASCPVAIFPNGLDRDAES